MAARSKIARLPADTRGRIDAFLAERDRSVDEFTAFLVDEIGLEISRTSAHRYQQKFDKVAARLREAREVTEALAAELGDAATQGKQGRLLVEMARSLVFDLMMKLQEMSDGDDAVLSPKDVAHLGKGLAELGRALRFDQDFETKIRETVAQQAAERAVAAVEAEGEKLGHKLPPEALTAIREQIYGIVDTSPGRP